MPYFPPWFLLVGLAYQALIFVGPALFGAAVVSLSVPALRRRARVRRAAFRMLATCVLLLLVALPLVTDQLAPSLYAVRVWAATRRLRAPQTVGGIRFPAGSTVQQSPFDGSLETGRVPSPTVIAGLPLVGEFNLQNGSAYQLTGTLATRTIVNGVPCGPGPLTYRQDEITRCVLARPYAFEGHALAGGRTVEIYRPVRAPSSTYFPDELKFGVLAGPEVLVDVTWPAGTIVGGITAPPQAMAHRWSSGDVAFCLPPGQTAEIGGATLHGFIGYYVRGDILSVRPECDLLPDHGTDVGGYAQVGSDRFHLGERTDSASQWLWSTATHW